MDNNIKNPFCDDRNNKVGASHLLLLLFICGGLFLAGKEYQKNKAKKDANKI